MKGRGKGPAFERDVCKRLSLWVSHFKRQDIFWRSAMSGGRSTVMRRKGQRNETAGDICATHRLGQVLTDLFVVECKFYADLQLDGYFFLNMIGLRKFWRKLIHECGGQRTPLLIVKQNFRAELTFTSNEGLRILRWGGKIEPHVTLPKFDMHCIFTKDLLMLKFDRIRKLHSIRKNYHE